MRASNVIQLGGLGAHTAGSQLSITDYELGGIDHLYFAGASTSFTSLYSQANVSFNGVTGYGTTDFGGAYFEVTPVPEPGTWIGGLLGLVVISFVLRRRLGVLRRTV